MVDLGEWLLAQGGRKREAGVWDCVTMQAEWCVANGWPDPMEDWRGSYDSEDVGLAFVRDAGGMVALFDCAMVGAGVPRRDGDPQIGDVGVLSIQGHEAGAIFTGKRWAFVANRGLGFASVHPDCICAVWEVARG